jgi:hypothetical protein
MCEGSTVEHFALEEARDYIPPLPRGLENDTPKVLIDHRNQIALHRVLLVNRYWDALRAAWPEGTGVHYFVAFELWDGPDHLLLEDEKSRLCDASFRNEVINEVEKRRLRESGCGSNPSTEESDYEEFSDEVPDGQGDTKSKSWKEREVNRFKKLIIKLAGKEDDELRSWRTVHSYFRSHTKLQCKNLYKDLKKSGALTVTFPGPRLVGEVEDLVFEDADRERVKHVCALQFDLDGKTAYAGFRTKAKRELALQSPVANYLDPVTHQRIVYPAVSPDGMLCCMETWMKIGGMKARDFCGREVKCRNARDLKPLCPENIRELIGHIRNLKDCRPPNPRDDTLKEFLGADAPLFLDYD